MKNKPNTDLEKKYCQCEDSMSFIRVSFTETRIFADGLQIIDHPVDKKVRCLKCKKIRKEYE